VISNLPVINVYKKKSIKSKLETQLLYGESFRIIKKYGYWFRIKSDLDGYKGYIQKKKFALNHKNTHKVCSLFGQLYSQPDKKFIIRKTISFSSKIKVIDKKYNFYKFDNFWIKKKDLKIIKYKNKNIFKNINKFIGIKYIWGGKHYSGVDCSGLVQLFFNFNNKYCPRDSKDQIKYFKKKIKLKNIQKNDLIFWKGHVAIAVTKKDLIHAYGPLKSTIKMNIKKTIDKIYNTANLKVIGVRRIT
jgi:gamma-D-glutamyl-L-lysine dipeptidyl-peptidase